MRKCINQLNESIYQIFRRSFLWWGHLSEVEDVQTAHICDTLNSQHKQLNAQKTLFDGANGNLNLVQAKHMQNLLKPWYDSSLQRAHKASKRTTISNHLISRK